MNFSGLFRFLLLVFFFAGGGLLLTPPVAATLQGLDVGSETPDFALSTLSGEARSLEELQGEKLTAVIFWSTWAPKSQKLLERFQGLAQKYRDQGLAVIGINVDGTRITPETRAEIKAVEERLRLDFPMLIDQELRTFHDFGVIALPSTVIIDRDRIIRFELSGYPLVGSERLADFVGTAMTGETAPTAAAESGPLPDKKALRLYNMGRNTLKSGRMAATAGKWFQQAIEADPDFLLPRLSLAEFHRRGGDLEKAREEYRQVLVLAPENPVALCEMAKLLSAEGKAEEATALLEKALQADGAYPPCHAYLGYLLGRAGRRDEAIAHFELARESSRFDPDLAVYRAEMHEALGEKEEAATQYRQALEIILTLER